MIVRELLTKWGFKIDQKPIKQLSTSVDRIKKDFRTLSIVAGAATLAVGFFARSAGKFEQVQIAFETMLGSAEKAKILLEEITQFAKITPFQLTGLLESSKRLLAFGFSAKQILPTLESLGNISAGVGRDKLPQLILALGQVRAATRLRGQELRQFTEAGVPLIEELAKELGVAEKEIQTLVSGGKVGFKDVNQALLNLTTGSGRFADLMTKQSKSFLGIISNIIDTLEIFAIKVGSELLPELKELANGFLEFLDINREIIKQNLLGFLKSMGAIAKVIFAVFFKGIQVLLAFAESLGGVERAVKFLSIAFGLLFGVRLLANIGLASQALIGLIFKVRTLGTAALVAQAKLIAIPIAVGAAVIALLLIFEDIVAFFQGRDSFFGQIVQGFQILGPVMQALARSILGPFSLLVEFGDRLIAMFTAIPQLLQSVKSFLGVDIAKGLALGGAGGFPLQTAPEGAAAGLGGSNVNVQAPITVNVPEGTPASVVGPAISEGLSDAMSRIMRSGFQAAEPQVEF